MKKRRTKTALLWLISVLVPLMQPGQPVEAAGMQGILLGQGAYEEATDDWEIMLERLRSEEHTSELQSCGDCKRKGRECQFFGGKQVYGSGGHSGENVRKERNSGAAYFKRRYLQRKRNGCDGSGRAD